MKGSEGAFEGRKGHSRLEVEACHLFLKGKLCLSAFLFSLPPSYFPKVHTSLLQKSASSSGLTCSWNKKTISLSLSSISEAREDNWGSYISHGFQYALIERSTILCFSHKEQTTMYDLYEKVWDSWGEGGIFYKGSFFAWPKFESRSEFGFFNHQENIIGWHKNHLCVMFICAVSMLLWHICTTYVYIFSIQLRSIAGVAKLA